MSGRNSRARKKSQSGNSRKADHKRDGKILSPPILALGNVKQMPWLRDSFPDMIWICALISSLGDQSGMKLVANVVDLLNHVTGNEDQEEDQPPQTNIFTGTLTSFDRVSPKDRTLFLETLDGLGIYEKAFPEEFRNALLPYVDLPARWLFDRNTYTVGTSDNKAIESTLWPIVADSIHGQSDVSTKAKTMIVRAYLSAGKLNLTQEIAQEWFPILSKYPSGVTEEERSRIEPAMRSAFLTLAQLGDDNEQAVNWARSFWRQNWTKFECSREQSRVEVEQANEGQEAVKAAHDDWIDDLNELHTNALNISRAADPDLYNPDKHEVLTGLVFRQIEFVRAMIYSPALWHIDTAAGTTRGLIETRIILKWMLTQDPEIFFRFKEYGQGKLKLYKLHAEELRDSLDDPPETLNVQIDHLQSVVNEDIWEEFQQINIAGNFASVDTRKMAERVGLLENYKLICSPASAAVHGEWGAISKHTLTRCRNPLHKGHRIPQDLGSKELGAFHVDFALKLLSNLVNDYKTALS